MTSPNASHCLKPAVRPIRGHVWHGPRTLNLQPTQTASAGWFQRCLKHLPVILATRSLLPYFAHIVPVKFAHPHLLIIVTEAACHHNSFWGSRCDSNHAPTISIKPCISFAAISAIPLTHDTFHHMAYLITSNGHQVHFPTISVTFSPNSLHFS